MNTKFAFAFDLDGTIVDSVYLIEVITEEISKKFELELTEEKKQEVDEITTEILNQENFKRIGAGFLLKIYRIIGLNFIQRLRALFLTNKIYKQEVKNVKIFDGTEKVFDFLDAKSIPYAIATTCSKREADDRLSNYPKLRKRFDGKIITRDKVEKIKPHPDQLLMVSKILNVPVKNLIMVGDMQADVGMGKNAGCITIGVLSGYATKEKLEELKPDFLFNSIVEIIDNFDKIKNMFN